MFVDASALCAILLNEPERAAFLTRMMDSDAKTSPVALWETVRAVTRETGQDETAASRIVDALIEATGTELVSVGLAEKTLSIQAFDRFGKGRHPAALNMGDCFAYACARSLAVPLLYKGDDFGRTDIEAA